MILLFYSHSNLPYKSLKGVYGWVYVSVADCWYFCYVRVFEHVPVLQAKTIVNALPMITTPKSDLPEDQKYI